MFNKVLVTFLNLCCILSNKKESFIFTKEAIIKINVSICGILTDFVFVKA